MVIAIVLCICLSDIRYAPKILHFTYEAIWQWKDHLLFWNIFVGIVKPFRFREKAVRRRFRSLFWSFVMMVFIEILSSHAYFWLILCFMLTLQNKLWTKLSWLILFVTLNRNLFWISCNQASWKLNGNAHISHDDVLCSIVHVS